MFFKIEPKRTMSKMMSEKIIENYAKRRKLRINPVKNLGINRKINLEKNQKKNQRDQKKD